MSVTDRREYIRLDVGYLDNPKIADALDESPLAVLAHVASMTHSRQHRTDGKFVVARILRKVGATADDARVLLDLGLWDDIGDGKAELHDYLKHQESAEQIARLSEAGKKGAAGRWAKNRTADRTTDGNADRYAEERRGEERPSARAADANRIADGTEPPRKQERTNSNAVLLAAGLGDDDRKAFLGHLRDAGARSPSAVVLSLDANGQLADRIAEWRDARGPEISPELARDMRLNPYKYR
ncbi:hypothetical protein [Isoptericola sp. NPDC056134]|uniref:hypothetical protein n=1 Tax=Isoptericola sp. NPDC056134 TaxID=3345723 RepID=UPI0035EF5759